MGVAREDPSRHAASLRHARAWMSLPARAWNSWFASRGDFSHDVREAMDGCLACKSCAGQCPIKVDVPAFRSRFLELYYGRYLRPVRHRAVGALERHLPWLARMPALYNFTVESGPGRALLAAVGLVSLPTLPRLSMARRMQRNGVGTADPDVLRALPAAERRRAVVIVPDAFTLHFEPELVLDFCELVRLLGGVPWLAPYRPNGKPQHVLGLLGDFERTAARNAKLLRALAASGVPLVGLDPSLTLTYRSEYTKVFAADDVPEVLLPQEWLASRLDDLPQVPPDDSPPWLLLPHCTERTNAPRATTEWERVCAHLGVKVRVLPSGCCGMAGLYGHEAAHRITSDTIYGLSWADHVGDPRNAGRLLATGYSCRSQVSLLSRVTLQHPVQVLLAKARASPRAAAPRGEKAPDYSTVHHDDY